MEKKGWLESKWTRVDGIRMHARVSANPLPDNAPLVVLVHGMGISSRYFAPTAVRLATRYRTFAPDLPGFGLSDKPKGRKSLGELVDWLAAWTRSYGIKRAAFVGNSLGCQFVADLAVRYPELVQCAALVGPTTDPQAQTIRAQLKRWRENDPHEPKEKQFICWRDYIDCGVKRLVRSFRMSLEDHIEGKLPHVKPPTAVIRGGLDPIIPQRWAEEATRLLPQGRLIVVPGAYHTVNFSSPLELVRVLRPFFDEHLGPGEKPLNRNTTTTTIAV